MRPALLALTLLACNADDADDSGLSDQVVPAASLSLQRTEDVNGTVTTKGLGVLDDGRIALWNYNQDQLEIWDGTALTSVASGLVTSFGTDLHVAGDGIFVTKGDSGTGDSIGGWTADGAPAWDDNEAIAQFDGTWLGLGSDALDGMHVLFVANAATNEVTLFGPPTLPAALPVDGVPVDVAVELGVAYVLVSTTTNPVGEGAPVDLVAIDVDSGQTVHGPVPVFGGTYLTVLEGRIAVSVNDFDAATRSIAVFSSDLAERIDTPLPATYTGFAGGIDAHDGALYISAQEGTGSDPICDVLVYTPAT